MNKIPKTYLLALLVVAASAQRYSAPRRTFGSSSNSGSFGSSSAAFGSNFNAGAFGRSSGPVVPILRDDRNGPNNGAYDFWFRTGNGIERREQGAPTGPRGAVESSGSWSFTFPDGTPASLSFVADENGYRPESSMIPTPPPLPRHAIEQIEFARRSSGGRPSSGGQAAGGRPFNSQGRYYN
ncbi:Cuticle Protein CPR RR Uncl [Hyalella azteca]|uniref:Cuticle Protein CPR RR Uncl n=1 Tax=Hyalella azteca TaxID=294128 RepID=A0A6A0H908_HYAAZ|nr:cuticle protein AM1199 [Hyalella azteca]KAA0201505.1 Cuticle Protein CPR RR Uncl [Hyalella azteca]